MSFLTWIVGHDEENAAAAAAADARLRQENEKDAPKYGAGWAAQVSTNYAQQDTFDPKEQRKEIHAAFAEGAEEGAQNVTGFIAGIFRVVGRMLTSVLAGIPLWVWLIVGAVIWWQLGRPGWQTLKKKLPA
jgi:hypothetical protein